MKTIFLAQTSPVKEQSKKLLVTEDMGQALILDMGTVIHGKLATQGRMSEAAVS